MIRSVAARVGVASLIIAPFVGLSATPANASTVTPAGIDATGAQDDTAALQALINGLPDGSTLSFPAGGKYRIEGTLHVKNKNDLTIDGNGALFFATTTGDRTRSQWSFEGGSNIVVQDVVVKGANPNAGTGSAAYVASLEAQHAFNIWSTNGIELDHVTATDVYGDFVYVGLQAGGLAKNVYIHDSTFARNGRQGISVTGADGVRIVHNTITDTRRATFDIEPNGPSWGAFNVDIEDNTIGQGRLLVLAGAGVGPEKNIVFAHNTINRPFNISVGDTKGGRRGPFTIADNTGSQTWGSSAGSAALNFTNIDGLTVTGNVVPLQAGRGDYGVNAMGSCDVMITDNTFTNAVAPYLVTPGPDCTTTASQSATTTTNTTPTPPPATSSTAPKPSSPPPATSYAQAPQVVSPVIGGPAQPTTRAPSAGTTANSQSQTPDPTQTNDVTRGGQASEAPATPAASNPDAKNSSLNPAGVIQPSGNGPAAPKANMTRSTAALTSEGALLSTTSDWNPHMWRRGLYTALAAMALLIGWLRVRKVGVPRRHKSVPVKTVRRHPGLATTVWGSSEGFPPRHVR